MINMNFFLIMLLFVVSNSKCQSNSSTYYAKEKLVYERTILTNDDETIIDSIVTEIKQVVPLGKGKILVKVDNFFPLCANARNITKMSSCKNDFNNDLMVIDLEKKAIFRTDFFKSSNDSSLNKDCEKIVENNAFVIIDSIKSYESSYLNGIQYDNNGKIYFFPFVNYSDSVLVVEEDIIPQEFLCSKFPKLIKNINGIKTFSRIGRNQGGTQITIDSNLRITEFTYYPNQANISSYKFKLVR
jgi:hypothetical protein